MGIHNRALIGQRTVSERGVKLSGRFREVRCLGRSRKIPSDCRRQKVASKGGADYTNVTRVLDHVDDKRGNCEWNTTGVSTFGYVPR